MVETNAPTMVAAMWTVTAVALLFFVLRVFFKWRYGKKITLDDWILGTSWCLLTVYTALTHVATKYGLGYHYLDIPDGDLPYAQKYLTIGEFFAVLALQISKTSFAVTLLHLVTRKWQTIGLWAVIVSLNVVMGIDAIIIFASCHPIEKIWRSDVPGKCWRPEVIVNVSIFAGVYSGVMDLVLAAFPIVLLQPLKIQKKEKIGVCVAMSLGVFAGITAFIKSSYMPKLGRWKDVTYSSYIILIWAAAEASVTIVATSIPFLRLALMHPRSRTRGYEVADEEVHMDRVIPNSKTDWTASTLTSNKRVALPAAVKRYSSMKAGVAPLEEVEPDTWERYTAGLG